MINELKSLPTPAMRITQAHTDGQYGIVCAACGQWFASAMVDVLICPCGKREFGGHVMREYKQRRAGK